MKTKLGGKKRSKACKDNLNTDGKFPNQTSYVTVPPDVAA